MGERTAEEQLYPLEEQLYPPEEQLVSSAVQERCNARQTLVCLSQGNCQCLSEAVALLQILPLFSDAAANRRGFGWSRETVVLIGL